MVQGNVQHAMLKKQKAFREDLSDRVTEREVHGRLTWPAAYKSVRREYDERRMWFMVSTVRCLVGYNTWCAL